MPHDFPAEQITAGVPEAQRQEIANVENQLLQARTQEIRGRFVNGLGWTAVGVGVAAAIWTGSHHNDKLGHDMPFVPQLQNAVESVDGGLADVGAFLLPASVLTVGAIKVGSRFNPTLRSIDRSSSQELTDDGRSSDGRYRAVLRKVGAGTLPGIAITAVGVAGLMSSLGEEISNGPDRPIQQFFASVPGDTMVTQYPGVMPMVESNLPIDLSDRIVAQAAAQHITATSIMLNLGQLDYKGRELTTLTLGIQQPKGSELDMTGDDCEAMPVKVDAAANIPVGSTVELNGVTARVVGELHDASAINRIGIEASRQAVAQCLESNADAPNHAIILDTDKATAQEIVETANINHNATAVIDKAQYDHNSQEFWTANVKPITNVMALMAGLLSFVSMGGLMSSRLLRNRREWATKLSAGVSENHLRATELLRATKDGVLATAIGTVVAAGAAFPVNMLESGLRVGVDVRSALVGSAVGLLGSIGGALQKVRKPRKIINPSESTRT